MNNMIIFRNSLRPFTRGALFYLCLWGGMGLFFPFLNVYFRHGLNFSGHQIGLLAMFMPFMTLVISMPVSALADRKRWRVKILTGLVLSFGLMLLFGPLPRKFAAWVLLLFGIALFYGPIVPLADSLIARMSLRRHLNYGSMRMFGSLSFALSAIIGGYVWELTGFTLMFPVAGAACLPLAFFASTLEESTSRHQPKQRERISLRNISEDSGLLILLIASFLIGASIYLSIMFDGIYMQALGGAQALIGFMFGFGAFSEIPAMQYSKQIADSLSTPKTLLLGYSLMTCAFVGYCFTPHPVFLLFMAALRGGGFGLFYVNTVRLASERAPEEWASTVQSMFSSATFGLAPLLFAPLGGILYDIFDVRSIYACSIVCVSGAFVIMSLSIFRGIFTEKSASVSCCAVKS